jgi:16S rRNA (adenine1518-N6/adenine1519-N6)-dimethyltransferase
MLTKNELREILDRYGLRPLKRLGQNFLIDANIKDKVVAAAGLSGRDLVLEIGPGLGALTADLARSAERVFAVEKDRKAVAVLRELIGPYFPNLKLIEGDILKFDIAKLGPGRIKVVGNLPYYITTPIIERLVGESGRVSSAVIMVQREVAGRILARPGSKDYGSLSLFIRYHTRPSYLFTIKRTSFYPEPEVDSSLIRLEFLERPSVPVRDEALFFRVVRGSFNQRRKTILNSLSREAALGIPKEELSRILAQAGVAPSARPETLGLHQFARITDVVSRHLSAPRSHPFCL